ncbi:MAG: exodeoxyribonuclease V subunit alpha [Victivallaceae bacterium]|nr:exodeoxyribonuclease V subunit alpha [Victivallaceae bacterium]
MTIEEFSSGFAPAERLTGFYLLGRIDEGKLSLGERRRLAAFAAGALAMRAVLNGGTAFDPAPGFTLGDLQFSAGELRAGAQCVPGVLELEFGLIYLAGYRSREVFAAETIRRRRAMPPPMPPITQARVAEVMGNFAPPAEGENLQITAVVTALSNHVAVISGGPGCGKTTVAAAVLALELERNFALRIVLVAPTGKAQSRLAESIRSNAPKLRIAPEIQNRLESFTATTLHQLLKIDPRTHLPKRNGENPLSADLLVLDESSMVPLGRMFELFSALPDSCRILLLGDRHQLASIESGAVFAELCRPEAAVRTTELIWNYRSQSAPHVACAGRLIRELADCADANEIACVTRELALLSGPDYRFEPAGSAELRSVIEPVFRNGHSLTELPGAARQGGAEAMEFAMDLAERFRILTSMRDGPLGVNAFNRRMLVELGLEGDHAPGVPLMIAENSYELGLMNGDTGLFWRAESGEVRAFFDRGARSFSLAELPPFETAFAMTVHKSQGSGYERVLLILPGQGGEALLTRELVYTGVTRSSGELILRTSPETLRYALSRVTRRVSGLSLQLSTEA